MTRNAETSTVVRDHAHGIISVVGATKELVEKTTGHLPTTTNHRRSTFDEEGDQQLILMKAIHHGNQPWTSTSSDHCTSHCISRSRRLSRRSSHLTSIARRFKHEDSTETERGATNDRKRATSSEQNSTVTNRHSDYEVSFSHHPKGEKFPELDSLLAF